MPIVANLATKLACFVRARRTTLLVGALVVGAVVSTRAMRLNISPSLPLGFYRLASVPAEVSRGALVVLPVPASVQHLWSASVPLLKPVAGIAGDVVCFAEQALAVNGTAFGAVYQEAQGHPLPQYTGCTVIPTDHVFLASQATKSLDSRYFLSIPISALSAVALPVLTFGGTPHGTR